MALRGSQKTTFRNQLLPSSMRVPEGSGHQTQVTLSPAPASLLLIPLSLNHSTLFVCLLALFAEFVWLRAFSVGIFGGLG